MYSDLILPEDGVNDLFDKGKVLITAYKEADIDVVYRPFVALFADKTLLVNDVIKIDETAADIVDCFCLKYGVTGIKKEYVSANLIKAVYLRAQDFEWYRYQYSVCNNLSNDNFSDFRNFICKTVENSKCLSVSSLLTSNIFHFYSPDKYRFALMDNGMLIISENSPCIETLQMSISELYPNIDLIKIVPDAYLWGIYENKLYTQLSAREIYINMYIEQLQATENISLWEAFKSIKKSIMWKKMQKMSEQEARSMIYSLHFERYMGNKDERWQETMRKRKNIIL
jgi:hypothetical protein